MDDNSDGSPDGVTPDWGQIALAVVCIAALTLGAIAAPTFAGTTLLEAPQIDGAVDDPPEVEGLDGVDGPGGGPGGDADGSGDSDEGEDAGGPGEGSDEESVGDPGAGDDVGPPAADDETRLGGDAEFTAADETVHFTVRADQPAYWRLTAYDEYDGDGWLRSADERASDRVPREFDRDVLLQEVTPQVELSAMPAAWRPIEADHPDAEFAIDSAGGLQAAGTLDPGVSATVTSARPVTDSGTLSAAGTDYPDRIEDRYTDLPEDVPDRVHDRTAEIVEDAETPYETATTITGWFRENREYALDVPPPEGDVTDEMLFEREAAYCAYFATAATVMLRSEGVPARYVVGYNAGEYDQAAEEYVVRGMHAHAWVEVYFPDVGWVPFEPTPPSDRAAAIDAAATAGEPAAEAFDPEAADEESEDEPSDEASQESEEETLPYDVTIDGELVPGTEVTVSVTEDDEPVEGATVYFDGEPIGTTDADGAIDGEVPFVETLEITVDPPAETVSGISGPPVDGSLSAPDSRVYAGTPLSEPGSQVYADASRSVGNVTVDTEADIDVSVVERPLPNRTVTVSATIGDGPLPEATVSIDGEAVGTTGPDGSADVSLPDRSGPVTVVVSRGELEGTVDLEIQSVNVSVPDRPMPEKDATIELRAGGEPLSGAAVSIDDEPFGTTGPDGLADGQLPATTGNVTVVAERDGVRAAESIEIVPLAVTADTRFPLPGRSAGFAVEHDGEPVANATVTVDGEPAGTTDANGSTTAGLPFANAASVGAEYRGASAETTVAGLYRNLAIAIALPLALLGIVLWRFPVASAGRSIARRSLVFLRSTPDLVRRAAVRLVDGLVAVARLLERFGLWLLDLARRGLDRLLTVGRWLLALPAEVAAHGLAALEVLHPVRLYRRLWAFLGRTIAATRQRVGSTAGRLDDRAGDDAAESDEPDRGLRRLWGEFLRIVDPPRLRTRTPGEIARYAIARGFPERPVRTVVETFRATEYGRRSPSREELQRVQRAVDATAEDSGPADAAAKTSGRPDTAVHAGGSVRKRDGARTDGETDTAPREEGGD